MKTFSQFLAESPTHFIRYGDVPEGDRSRNHALRSKKPRHHKGLSVYAATHDSATNQWVIDDSRLTFQGREGLFMFRHDNDRPIYLMTGNVVDLGPDNEPLIKQARTIQTLQPSNVRIPHLDEPEAVAKHAAFVRAVSAKRMA